MHLQACDVCYGCMQERSPKFVLGRYKRYWGGLSFNTHSSITILTLLLLHKKFTWPDFGRG